MRPRNLCNLAQKKAISNVCGFYLCVALHRNVAILLLIEIMWIIFVWFQFHSHHCINIRLYSVMPLVMNTIHSTLGFVQCTRRRSPYTVRHASCASAMSVCCGPTAPTRATGTTEWRFSTRGRQTCARQRWVGPVSQTECPPTGYLCVEFVTWLWGGCWVEVAAVDGWARH